MKYKLIVSDFDGTLCRSDNTVSEYSKEVIEEYFKRGGIFTLSSGRSIASLRTHLDEAGLTHRDIPLLGLQGSVIEENLTGRVLYEKGIGRETALWFSKECEKRGVYHHVYTKGEIFSSAPNMFTELYTRLAGVGMNFVGNVSEFLEQSERDDFIKILAITDDKEKTRYGAEIAEQGRTGVEIFTSGPYFFECINSGAGKGNGLKKIAELLNVKIEETMSFGDEMNDRTMIEAAGLGVAMDNARKELKDRADAVAPSNDMDGVAKTIVKYCF